jgi:hypothetical protein
MGAIVIRSPTSTTLRSLMFGFATRRSSTVSS